MVVSIPEKTLEHWASIYLTYRYRSKVPLWWPTSGADVVIDPGNVLVGKTFWLELKTATPLANGTGHYVEIDLDQLNEYMNPAPGTAWAPVYYVFPTPRWVGEIRGGQATSWLAGAPPSQLAFRRAGAKWFGAWTWVVSGAALFSAYRSAITHGQKTAQMGRIVNGEWVWAKPLRKASPVAWEWTDFWDRMQACGSDDMPAVFGVPTEAAKGPVTRSRLVNIFRDAIDAENVNEDTAAEIVYAPQLREGLPNGRFERIFEQRKISTPDTGPHAQRSRALVTVTVPALELS